MKNYFIKSFLVLSLLMASIGCGKEEDNDTSSKGSAYICTGKGAYAYHANNGCRGLNNCKGDIVSISLSEAKKTRKPCDICY